jgi:hypothetical protein
MFGETPYTPFTPSDWLGPLYGLYLDSCQHNRKHQTYINARTRILTSDRIIWVIQDCAAS